MKFELPLKIESVANKREHWSEKSKRTKHHRQQACFMTPARATVPCIVTMTRIGPRELDDDNLASAFKAVRDGIADKLGVNDNDKRIQWRYAQRKGKPKEYSAEIEIQSAARELEKSA